MIRALYTAASGMNAQQTNIDNVAHNLANVNTTGFKKSRVEFEDLVYQEMRAAGVVGVGDDRSAGRPRDRPRHARGRDGAQLLGRQPALDRRAARHGHRGRRLLPDLAAERHDRLHARRHVPPRRAGR